jgi:hypothetical protein
MGYDIYYTVEIAIEPPLTPELVEFVNNLSNPNKSERTLADMGFEVIPTTYHFLEQLPSDMQQFRLARIVKQEWIDKHPNAAPSDVFEFRVSDDGTFIEFDGESKWPLNIVSMMLTWLADYVFGPAGHVMNGGVHWDGEESGVSGYVHIVNNKVSVEADEVITGEQYKTARLAALVQQLHLGY